MIALPPPLAPWAEEVEQLPGELALGLYPLLARLASALGALPGSTDAPLSEPEGYAGLSPRGPYHRLLPSEWLLATELPDEFLRRAVNAEQLFFALAHSRTSGSRRALALFDAGPTQHGAPRVVQIAALIAFARRARLAGATFHFGTLQAPQVGLAQMTGPRSLDHLLHARSVEAASEAHAQAWSDTLGALQREDDAWIVGGPDLRSLGAFARWPRIVMEEPLDPERREVSALLEHPRRPAQRISLELPPPDDCVQLVRDPYRSATAKPQRASFTLDLARTPWFSGDGRRLFAWLADGSVVSYPVPNSPRATAGKPRLVRPRRGEVVLACGSIGRRLLMLTRLEGALLLQGRAKERASPDLREGVDLADADGNRLRELDPNELRPGVIFEVDGRIWVVGARGQLYFAEPRRSGLRGQGEVFAVAPLPGFGLLRVTKNPKSRAGHDHRHACIEVDGKTPRRDFVHLPPTPQFHFGYLSNRERCLSMLNVGSAHMVKSLPSNSDTALLHVPPGGTFKGVLGSGGKACLLILEGDRRTLSLIGRASSTTFARANADVLHAIASVGGPHFAYTTESGELVVHTVTHAAPVLRVLPSQAS